MIKTPFHKMSRRHFLQQTAAVAGTATLTSPPGPARSAGQRPRIALALGSGAIHGIVHIGVLKACEAHNFQPDLITGTSAGAIVGALWAAGHRADALETMARQIGWWEVASLPDSLRGLASNTKLADFIAAKTDGKQIEDLPTPLALVATDLATGQRVILDHGDLGAAVAASSCVPVLFEPVLINGQSLVDGGLTEPVPVRAARELGATRVLAVDVQYRPREGEVGRLVSIGFQAMQILIASLTEEQISEADVSIRLDVHEYMRKEPYAGTLIDLGQAAFDQHWPQIHEWTTATTPVAVTPIPGCYPP